MKRAVLALLLMALPSAAQEVEQVTVYGGSLSGFWHVNGPSWLQMNLFGKTTWGPLRGAICRIGHDHEGYNTHCFNQKGSGGTLEVDGSHFHLAWGSMLARMVYDGEVTSATAFHGHFAAKLMGIPITNPDVSDGNKIALDPATPDAAGKAGLLRAVLNGEAVAHDPKLDEVIAAARADRPGAMQQIFYLGMQGKAAGPEVAAVPDFLAVYAVEYADGERICWLHQDDDGKLAAFQCG
ncbi:MAG TPA: hypothetical protein VJQ06_10385 [Rhizomicrobium sp.]|nr:hypothetical protein [Rhizomicrobium sp.]